MKIVVYGLWHLGSVTAACLADKELKVTGLDDDTQVISKLAKGRPPLFEPGLEALVKKGLVAGNLSFTHDKRTVQDADLVWVTLDTPVDDDDRADIASVNAAVASLFPYLKQDTVVLVSSQLPAGSIRALQRRFDKEYPYKKVHFACSPENLRLGKAIAAFNQPDRIVAGVPDEAARKALEPLFSLFTDNILWMRVESAEMVKHSLNAYLATCITFINEIATLCEKTGADAAEVERGLRSEPRIGQKAYIKPGNAFAGGTLARDVNYLCRMAQDTHASVPLLEHIIASNQAHKQWIAHALTSHLGALSGKTIGIWGLAYTPGTDTFRRSFAVELCQWLHGQGAQVRAYDPNITAVPDHLLPVIPLVGSMDAAYENAHALVILTEYPVFKEVMADTLLSHMQIPLVVDQNGWINHLRDSKVTYVQLGYKHEPA